MASSAPIPSSIALLIFSGVVFPYLLYRQRRRSANYVANLYKRYNATNKLKTDEAREAFITGAGSLVLPVVQVDGKPVGEGVPGPVAKRLRALYIQRAKNTAV